MNDGPIPDPPKRSDYVSNPFGTDVARVQTLGALANAEQQRSIAEVQARMIIARSNPRDPMRCMDQILRDCTRVSLAKGALYQYARGGSSISGPSIRLAEAIAQRWGNIASGIKEISRSGGYSECVAYAWDLESGFYDERQFQVRHWRDTKQGGHPLTDERDIYELIANMGQRRKRAVLLTVIPGDVQEAAVEQCEETLNSNADTSPAAVKRMVEAFAAQFGVTQAQIEQRCQCRLEAIRPAQIVQLSKIFASIRDEMSAPADWFQEATGAWAEISKRHAASAKPAKAADSAKPADQVPEERTKQAVAEMQERKAAAPAQTMTEVAKEVVAEKAQSVADQVYWLVDGEGDIISGGDGQGGRYGDAMAFARALEDLKASTFPADWPALEAANNDDMDRAALASDEAATLFRAMRAPPKEITPEAPSAATSSAETQPERIATGVPVGSDLLGDLPPSDPLQIAKPEKDAKAAWERYADSAKVVLTSCTSGGMIEHFVGVNEAVYKTFPGKHRMNVLALIDARRKELAPPPAAHHERTPREIADGLLKDIAACASRDDLRVLDQNKAVAQQLATLKDGYPDLYGEVRTAAVARSKAITA